MNHRLFFDIGGHLRQRGENGGARLVPFPVCLAIRSGGDVPEVCPDFILDIEGSRVFIKTESPLPEGTPVQVHFYIPPENKLLAELGGRVSAGERRSASHPPGMFVLFFRQSRRELEGLEKYIEGTRRLLDRKA